MYDYRAQVVGWPPIRSFRKNSLATTSKNNDEVDGKPGPGALFIKVSMDGAPYLRKVDLRTYTNYGELSSALEKMFSCFTIGKLLMFSILCPCHRKLERWSTESNKVKKKNPCWCGNDYYGFIMISGQCGSHEAPGREMLSESKLKDLLHGSEYVLTYEDKDGDWMLVGDVPWE